MNKRAQAALEFLTTYGWAFLVITIMIGTLAYFGILNPSKLLPNRCNFGPEIPCLDFYLSVNTIRLKMVNSVGESIRYSTYSMTSDGGAISCTTTPSIADDIRPGNFSLIFSGCSGGGLIQGNTQKVDVDLTYYKTNSGPDYPKQVQGEIFGTVQ